jgi:hypothetical protein
MQPDFFFARDDAANSRAVCVRLLYVTAAMAPHWTGSLYNHTAHSTDEASIYSIKAG